MSTDNFNKIFPSGNTNILTYDDIKTRALNSIRIGTYSGRTLKYHNNIFIGDKSG